MTVNINKLFPSKYLGSDDLDNREFTLKVARVVLESMRNHKGVEEQKPVVYFQGAQKGLILNKTNAFAIGDAYGPETDNWIGKPITLYVTWVDAFGKRTQAIRVRVDDSPAPAPQEKTAHQISNDIANAITTKPDLPTADEDVDLWGEDDNPFNEPSFGDNPDEPF